MDYFCYIIYSKSLNKFYIGETEDLDKRLQMHNEGYFKESYTSKVSDWILYHVINCLNRKQARLIEAHIKRMKSRKYIENLTNYPELTEQLLDRFK